MISCKHCLTANSLDSTFCKHCGTQMPEAEVVEAKAKLEELVQTGFDLLKEGRSEEAMIIAENAVTSNPSSPAALSLKAMCHEGRGEAAEALECYERVVDLKPDSALDKIKVNQLRNLMVAKTTAAAASPDRRSAVLLAASIAVLVIVVGIFAVRSLTRAPVQVASNDNRLPQNSMVQSFAQPTPVATATPGPVNTPAPQPSTAPANTPDTTGGLPTMPPGSGGMLPSAGNDGSEMVPPIKVENPPANNGGSRPAGSPAKNPDDGTIVNPPSPSPSPSAPPKSDGQINITVHGQRPPSSAGNGGNGESGNGLQALLGAARSNFQLGHWSEAARNYEQAIAQGGGRASNLQRLGDCYRHLGQVDKAVDALTRAADSYEASGNQAGADSCRQAIKVLKGG